MNENGGEDNSTLINATNGNAFRNPGRPFGSLSSVQIQGAGEEELASSNKELNTAVK